MQNTYNITFSINRAHLLFAMVTLYSLLKNNQKYYFDIYILHNNCLKQEEIEDICNKFPLNQFDNFKIHLIDCSNIEVLKSIDVAFRKDAGTTIIWPKEILFRLFLPQLLPNINSILHLDTDVMIRGNVCKLFEINDNTLFKGLYKDYVKDLRNKFNAGVMLINLKLARELNIYERIDEFLKVTHKTKNDVTEEYIISNLFFERIEYYEEDIGFNLISKHDNKRLKNKIYHAVAIHFIRKPFDLERKWINKQLFMEYYSYLQDFIDEDKKFQIKLVIIVSNLFIANYLSIKRRLKKILVKYLKIKPRNSIVYANQNNIYMKNKIYKYAIIKKQYNMK